MNRGEKKNSIWRRYSGEICIFGICFVCVNAIYIVNHFREFSTSDAEYAEHFGAFIGGYFGPIFAVVGVLLLFVTLKDQRLTSALQHFETKYFELIKMHRDNVEEIGMKGGSGRRLFVLIMRELRSALALVQDVAINTNQRLSRLEMLQVAYYCVFFGVGPNSSRMLKISLSGFDKAFIDAVESILNTPETKTRIRNERKFAYVPFEGHQSRLGHYYRHLYQLVDYVHSADPSLKIDKYKYIKTIRAQLSTHEQAMLLVNSLTPLGKNWWKKGLIETYRLVKNIPQKFFNEETEIDTSKFFEPGYFEWES